jgi:hypothetical protein
MLNLWGRLQLSRKELAVFIEILKKHRDLKERWQEVGEDAHCSAEALLNVDESEINVSLWRYWRLSRGERREVKAKEKESIEDKKLLESRCAIHMLGFGNKELAKKGKYNSLKWKICQAGHAFAKLFLLLAFLSLVVISSVSLDASLNKGEAGRRISMAFSLSEITAYVAMFVYLELNQSLVRYVYGPYCHELFSSVLFTMNNKASMADKN